jgi:hypothetical protein
MHDQQDLHQKWTIKCETLSSRKLDVLKEVDACLDVICTKLTEEFDVSVPPLTKLYEIETQYLKSSLHAYHRRGMIISLLSA